MDRGPVPELLGEPGRLGARVVDGGVEVATYSSVAGGVQLCVLSADGAETRVALEVGDDHVWRGRVDGGVGLRYGFRVTGRGPRSAFCDPSRLLLDPYARAVGPADRDAVGVPGGSSPRCSVVIDESFDWGDDGAPRTDWSRTLLYELHVRGATIRHPEVPPELRGTYLGIAHESVVAHLVSLGVTAVELQPVFEWVDEPFLLGNGLTDYWGYNPIAHFAATSRFCTDPGDPSSALREFRSMVRALHRAGIEVVLDVVYNHTAEGGADGETSSLKGLDADAYYRVEWGAEDGGEPRFVDTTGCGNSLNSAHPASVSLVLDSLRFWSEQCHVDGFRFDLAPTLGRPQGRFDPLAPILAGCASDPLLAGRKLVCEPWDLAEEDGYALGRFQAPYREWNGRFRDGVRDFWLLGGHAGELATLLAGTREQFGDRALTSSVNYVTSHDGFTLRDLVSYDRKHNEANRESNADGTDDNHSNNCGVEGPTDDPAVLARRRELSVAMLATVLLARGTPMLLGGDELGRTQGGNNNPYCQDNEVTWLDWERGFRLDGDVAELAAVRRRHAELLADPLAELDWCGADGTALADEEWAGADVLAMRLRSHTDALVVVVHRGAGPVSVTVALDGPLEVQAATMETSPEVGAELTDARVRLASCGVVAVGLPAR